MFCEEIEAKKAYKSAKNLVNTSYNFSNNINVIQLVRDCFHVFLKF